MMYDELYYFDGCSYVHGHDQHSIQNPWIDVINPAVYKDGNQNKHYYPHDINNSANTIRKKPYYNRSRTAKSNIEIYEDFITTLPDLIKANNVNVIIQWSHSERTYDSKNQDFLNTRYYEVPHDPQVWWDGVARTVNYMLDVQEKCKENNIAYSFITTEHPDVFKIAKKYNNDKYNEQLEKIDEKHIFNWPLRKLENFDFEFKAKKELLILWGCTSLPMSWCKVFDEAPANDYKHLDYDARRRFGAQVHDWIADRNKDLSYWIDETNNCNKEYFYNLKAWTEGYWDGYFTHWTEQQLQEILLETEIKPNAEYIYES